jgi:hypothetical protein
MPRKFSYNRDGSVLPTSKAVSDARHACAEYGIGSVLNSPYGPVFGYLLRLIEDKDVELAALRQDVDNLKRLTTDFAGAPLIDVSANFDPDGTPKKAYRNMNADERAAYKRSQGA